MLPDVSLINKLFLYFSYIRKTCKNVLFWLLRNTSHKFWHVGSLLANQAKKPYIPRTCKKSSNPLSCRPWSKQKSSKSKPVETAMS